MSQVLLEKLKEIALANGKQFALEVVAEVAIPALELAVQKSESKIDDAVLMALKEPLKMALLDLIKGIELK